MDGVDIGLIWHRKSTGQGYCIVEIGGEANTPGQDIVLEHLGTARRSRVSLGGLRTKFVRATPPAEAAHGPLTERTGDFDD